MKGSARTKAQLLAELDRLRQQVSQLEQAQGDYSSAEETLLESEERLPSPYSAMVEGVALHEVIYDQSGTPVDYVITDVNRAYEQILGIKREEAVGCRASELYGTGKAPFLDVYARTAQTGEPTHLETYFPPMDKHFTISVVCPAKGRFATIFFDVTEHKKAKKALQETHDGLERQVRERTADLTTANEALQQDITERKRAEEGLTGSEARYRELADSIADVFFAMDEDMRYTYWNRASEELTGIAAQAAIGKSLYELFPDVKGTELATLYQEVLRTRSPKSMVNEFASGGTSRFFEISAYPSADGLSVFTKDVTERKKAEDALRESETRFRTLSDATFEGIALSETGLVVDANQQFADMLGYEPSELLGMNVKELVAPEDRDLVESRMLSGSEEPYEHRAVRKDGTIISVELRPRMMSIEGRPVRMTAIHDVTERKKAEEALKLSEERYREVVEGAREGIVVIQDGMVKFFNSKALELTGYTPDELAEKPFLELIHPDDSDVVGEHHQTRLAGGEVPDAYPMRVVRGDGELLWLQVSGAVIEWEGRPAVLGFLSDITERMVLEHKMYEYQELDRMKSNLLATVSHELRTPLAIIQGYSTLLLGYEERLGVDEKQEYLRSIDHATHRLAELVDHLLDMSRLDAGLLKLETALHNAAQLVRETVQEGQVRYPGRRISIELEENLPDVNMDEKRIRQVLDNLLDNACKYSEDGTEVVVSARQAGQELLLSVSDQGIGIPADEKELVFDRLHRIENRLTAGVGGIGLGLSISKGLVEAHGGRIWAESVEGKGSTFHLALRLQDTR